MQTKLVRDPSDGSIRENPGITVPVGPVIDTSTSGLPITKAKADYLARLEESRVWLKDFVQKNSS